MKRLNIGCGVVYHPDWINLDKIPQAPTIQPYDICNPLPFAEDSIDVCYSSHVLEHLTQEQAQAFIADCWRILKPNGIIRIVVPDLEAIVKAYLSCLESVATAKQPDPIALANYHWLMLELLDQINRRFPGGEMANFLGNPQLLNRDFIRDRIGQEAEGFWTAPKTNFSLQTRLKHKNWGWFLAKSRYLVAAWMVRLIAGKSGQRAFCEGVFRQSGEIHQWMYDRVSLAALLSKNRFQDIQICQAMDSQIRGFNDYQLDIINGKVRKPDSLFMEARKGEF